MANWREELGEAVKSKAEREAEDKERQRKRVEEALTGAEEALRLATEALRFALQKLQEKQQPARIEGEGDSLRLTLGALSLSVSLDRETAILRATFIEGKPREFDFAKDRHIAATDVEEYVGRRSVEFVKAAQKASPW
jgi:hypothetical protein